MSSYTPQTLTLAACRSLDLSVMGECNRCNTRRQWVGARSSKLDARPIADLWTEGRFTCATCGPGHRLGALEVRMRGNTMRDGELVAMWPESNVGEVVEIGQRDGRAVLAVRLGK